MKVERKGENFEPITITLETNEEAELMTAIFGESCGSELVNDLCGNLYHKLYNLGFTGKEFEDNIDQYLRLKK